MKKLFLLLFLFLSINNVNASISKLSLEISRSKNIDKSIMRVNNIHNFIQLYILQTSTLPSDFSVLIAKYPGVSNLGYTNTPTIDFTIANNIVNYTGVVPSNLTDLSKQLYGNNPYLNPNSKVNLSTDLSIDIGLDVKSRQFLSKSILIKANDRFNVLDIQDTGPTCANVTQMGRLWYRPDGGGEYFIYTCVFEGTPATWHWRYVTNRIETNIYASSLANLSNMKVLDGTKAYVWISPTKVKEYIYGDDGNPVTNDWREVDTTP